MKRYIEGFNRGYALNRLRPDVAQEVKSAHTEKSVFAQGVQHGIHEHERELKVQSLAHERDTHDHQHEDHETQRAR